MQQHQQQNAGSPPPANNGNITLAQINEMLNDAGFPIIGPEKVQALQNVAPRERIIKAIRGAKNDPGARNFLQKTFASAGIPMGGNENGHQNGQPNNHPAAQPEPMPQQQNYQEPRQQYQNPQQQSNGGYPQNSPGQQNGYGNEQPDNSGNARMNPEDRVSMHVYGGKAALCFEADMTKQGVPTVALDGAVSTAPRQYNWQNKVRIQMTKAELPVVAAVLMGVIPSCEFSSHGQENNKGFSMERQGGGKVFVKVFEKGQPLRTVPIMAPDVFYVTSLVFRQLQKANPWLDNTSIMAIVRATQNLQ